MLINRLNKTEPAVFLKSRFSLFLNDPFSRLFITSGTCFFTHCIIAFKCDLLFVYVQDYHGLDCGLWFVTMACFFFKITCSLFIA